VITGPEGGAAGHGRLRASHADREQVTGILKTAFADGRLDKDELDTRVGQVLAARTCAELATATAGIPCEPAQALPPRPPARPPVNKEAVKWGLAATGAVIPPALFVMAVWGPDALAPLAMLAIPLLFIELPVVIIFVAITLARQHNDRLRASRGGLPPRPGQAGDTVEAERHGSAGPDPALPGACAGQASADLRVYRPGRDWPRRCRPGVPVPHGA
jgi:Domain of unknown function (DUF1707)